MLRSKYANKQETLGSGGQIVTHGYNYKILFMFEMHNYISWATNTYTVTTSIKILKQTFKWDRTLL